jgi:hypothetical protein
VRACSLVAVRTATSRSCERDVHMFDQLLPRIVAANDNELLDELAEYCDVDNYSKLFVESMVCEV